MKAVMIIFNIAHTKRVSDLLEKLSIRGYSWFEDIKGQGSNTGEPRMGTQTWPEINSAVLTIIDDQKLDALLDNVKKIDAINEEVGIRAFVWDILKSV